MIFRELKAGYTVHYVSKTCPLRTGTGKVINISLPQIDRQNMGSAQMVVDVTVDIDGKTRTYTVPDSQSIAHAPEIVLSTDKAGILRELEAMRTQAEDELSKVKSYEDMVEQASELIAELNPAEREKRETEARMGKLESQMESISEKISELLKKLK